MVEFPPLLDFAAPRLRAYPKETVVAEKVEAMVQLGLANTRMKDFFDIAVLADMHAFDGEVLVRAFRAIRHRSTSARPVTRDIAGNRRPPNAIGTSPVLFAAPHGARGAPAARQ